MSCHNRQPTRRPWVKLYLTISTGQTDYACAFSEMDGFAVRSSHHSLSSELVTARLALWLVADTDNPCRCAINKIGPILLLGRWSLCFDGK